MFLSSKHNILVFGEVLYDCFPNGEKVPGGAPFNVAWNLQALGQNPLFFSAVGNDSMGEALKDLADKWGLSLDALQSVEEVGTSTVQVEVSDGIPSYTIVQATAMDRIGFPEDFASVGADILYHGSLAARAETTFSTLSELRRQWKGKVFLDINVRNPHFDQKRFLPLINNVDYLKINDEEFAELANESLDDPEDVEASLRRFAEAYKISNIILTCGAKGALWCARDGEFVRIAASTNVDVVDTVGAGDAFASVCLHGICEGWGTSKILKIASEFAGKVCTIQGATTKERSFYSLAH